jgi:selenocysteine lyase/cysteine desulfurase
MNVDRFPAVLAAGAHGRILADNAGGTQLPDLALERMQRFLAYDNAQRGSVFARELAASELVEQAKRGFAALLAVPAERIGIGANATTLALAFSRLLASTIDKGNRIVVTAADHEANVAPWMWLRRFGAQVDVVPVTPSGELDESKYHAYLERAPRLVALPWASNVTGTVFDVARLARSAKRAGAAVVVDSVQALPHMPLEIDGAVDFAFFSGYKVYAPHVGFWYMSESAFDRFVRADDSHLPAEARYWTIETGTQSHEGLAGWLGTLAYFADVAGTARQAIGAFARYEAELSNYARRKFSERLPDVRLYGPPPSEERLPVFAFNVASIPAEELALRFERANIEGRVGDFYAPRLLQALAPDAGGRAVRLSFAHYNTIDEIDRCFDVIDAALSREQSTDAAPLPL